MVKKAVTYPDAAASLPSLDPSSSTKSGGRVEPATKFSIPLGKTKKKPKNQRNEVNYLIVSLQQHFCLNVTDWLVPINPMATHSQLASGQTLQAAVFKDRKKILSDASVFTINWALYRCHAVTGNHSQHTDPTLPIHLPVQSIPRVRNWSSCTDPKRKLYYCDSLNTQIKMTFTNYLSTYSPNTYACSWVLLLRVHRKKGSHVTWSCNSQDSCRNKQYRHNVHPNQYKSFQKIESSPFLLSTAQSCRNKSYTKKP